MHYDKPDRLIFGKQKKRTTEILSELRSTADFGSFAQRNGDEFACRPTVGKYIKDVLKSRQQPLDIPELAALIDVSRSYLYQLIPAKDKPPKTVKKNPDRKLLLAIAIALKFSVDETQHLLKYADEPELYPRRKFDAVILYALERRLRLVDTNILLESERCDLLIFGNEKAQEL